VCRGVVCGWTRGASSCAQEALTGSHARTIQWTSRNRIGLHASLHAARDSAPLQRTRSHPEVTNVTDRVSSGLETPCTPNDIQTDGRICDDGRSYEMAAVTVSHSCLVNSLHRHERKLEMDFRTQILSSCTTLGMFLTLSVSLRARHGR